MARDSIYEKYLLGLYTRSFDVKCPFFRRRAFESVDTMKFLLHKVGRRKFPYQSFSLAAVNVTNSRKVFNLSLTALASMIKDDWQGRNQGKGYYVTGQLSREIYDDNCFFDGPDPDMPVVGLQKYLLSAAHLFDHHQSRADLTRPLQIDADAGTIRAHWRIEGVINLPWHPQMKPMTGSTTYVIDPHSGLVCEHREQWDISVLDAFLSALFPWLKFGAPAALPVRYED